MMKSQTHINFHTLWVMHHHLSLYQGKVNAHRLVLLLLRRPQSMLIFTPSIM